MKKEKSNIEYILYAINQAIDAENFGFQRNVCCRNLKIAISHYWQNKTLGLHGQAQKKRILRSKEARELPLNKCRVEHSVPQMFLVNELMDMKNITKEKIEIFLTRYFCVRLISINEDIKLNASGFRSKMPQDWDKKDLLIRYKKVGIEF